MSLLRPLDPNFPIERQLGIEASPVVLVNVSRSIRRTSRAFSKSGRMMRRS